jgi:hypothetical protein
METPSIKPEEHEKPVFSSLNPIETCDYASDIRPIVQSEAAVRLDVTN